MRVALGIKEFTRQKGGQEGYALNLAQALGARGHEVHVFASRMDGIEGCEQGRPAPPAGAPGLRAHPVPVVAWSAPLKVWSFHARVVRAIAALSPPADVVLGLAQFFPLDVYRLGDGVFAEWLEVRHPGAVARALKLLTRPVFLVNLRLERRIMRGAPLLIANSRLVREQALRRYDLPEDRVVVVRNGVDARELNPGSRASRRLEARRRLGLAPADRVALFLGNDFHRKGLGPLIEALAAPALAGARLLVAGSDAHAHGHYERLARARGLSDERARFLGAVPHRETADLFAAADALALPTIYDAFSNACLEAMACGLPVVTTRANGAAELIEDGRSGFVLEGPDDGPALREALLAALDPARGSEAGRAAACAVRGLTHEACAEATLAVLERAAGERAARMRSMP